MWQLKKYIVRWFLKLAVRLCLSGCNKTCQKQMAPVDRGNIQYLCGDESPLHHETSKKMFSQLRSTMLAWYCLYPCRGSPQNSTLSRDRQEVEDEIAALNTDLGDLKLVVRSGKCCQGASGHRKSWTGLDLFRNIPVYAWNVEELWGFVRITMNYPSLLGLCRLMQIDADWCRLMQIVVVLICAWPNKPVVGSQLPRRQDGFMESECWQPRPW